MHYLQPGEEPEQLTAEEIARCADCGRTPLIGEHVYVYERAELVCELCRMLRPAEPLVGALVSHRLGTCGATDPGEVVRVTRRASLHGAE
jgi:hypothetical protein